MGSKPRSRAMFARSERRDLLRRDGPRPTCRNCGETPLFWVATDQGFRLHGYSGEIHVCPIAPLTEHRREVCGND